MSEMVILKMQRPLATNGSKYDVLSYIVDDDLEQVSNPHIEQMKKREVEELFGDFYKVYYSGEYREGKPINIIAPVYEDEWV